MVEITIPITASLVKELRDRTGTGMMACKKALVEAQGNIELAIDNLRKSGQAKSVKKLVQLAKEGLVLIKITPDRRYGAIIEINCETDFAAKESMFIKFCNLVMTTAISNRLSNVNSVQSAFEEQRVDLISKLGENINIRRFGVLEGDMVGGYSHHHRIGVIISTSGTSGKSEEMVKKLAMHIAASKPEYVNRNDVPMDIVSHEHQIQMDIARKSGKSSEITEKIVDGRIQKFISEISLTSQPFIIDPNKTVGQVLQEYQMKVNSFIRFDLGEGMTK